MVVGVGADFQRTHKHSATCPWIEIDPEVSQQKAKAPSSPFPVLYLGIETGTL
jgi:hypothetical protein